MGVVKNLMVRAGADFSAITKQANTAKRSMSSMERSVSKSCSNMSASAGLLKKAFSFAAVTAAVTATVAAAKSAKAAYDEQAEADAKLAQVMRNTMGASAGEVAAIQDLIANQERLGVVTGDAQTQGAQELATYLGLSSSLKTLIPVLNDMTAQQYGIGASGESVVSIATMMGKVMQGQTSALSRYGYTFTDAQERILKYGNESQRAAVLAEVVGESVGGMNAALAATPDGRLQQVNNRLGEIQEKFGGVVNSVLTLFIPAMNVACAALDKAANLADRAAQAVANVFGTKAATTAAVRYTGAVSGAVEEVESAATGAKEAMNELYGFDQITKLKDTSSSGGAVDVGGISAGEVTEVPVEVVPVESGPDSLGWLETWLTKVKTKAADIDLSPIKAAVARARAEVSPLCETMFDGLDWAIDNVLFPLASWGAESALPAFLDTLAGGASVLNSSLIALQPLGGWLWNNFLQPVASWTGGVIVGTLQGLANGLRGVSDWISTHQGAVQAMAVTAGVFCAAWGVGTLAEFLVTAGKFPAVLSTVATGLAVATKAKVANKIAAIQLLPEWVKENALLVKKTAAHWAHTAAVKAGEVASKAASVATGALSAAMSFLTSPIGMVVLAVAGLTAGIVLLVKNWDTVKATATNVWTSVQNVWGKASGWFSSTVLDPLKTGFKGFANGVIGFFEGVANGAISGVNKIITGINKISFDVPEWVPVIGGKQFGFNLPKASTVKLPRLAEGGVVTSPTRALLGERGPEAIVPLKDNASWLDSLASRISLLISGQKNRPLQLVIPVYVGGRKITERVIDDLNAIIDTTGQVPIHI